MSILDTRLRHGLFGLLLGGTLVFAGCASTGPKDIKSAPDSGQQKADSTDKKAQDKKAQDNKTAVEYINVVGDGDRVLIGTTGSIRYTVFKLSEPPRLIVDMPGVNLDKVTAPINVDNDFISEITAVSYGEEKDIGRVIINIKEGVDHEVKSGENSILVSLKKAAPAPAANESTGAVAKAAAADAVKEEPLAPAAQPPVAAPQSEPKAAAATEVAKSEAAPPAEVKSEKAVAPEKQASKILKIESSREGDNTVLRIVADGLLGNYNSFGLDNPSRIVVDIWGVDNAIGKSLVKVDDKYIKDVRIGTHQDKSRLVFDFTGKKLPPHSIKKVNDSIVLTLGPNVIQAKGEEGSAPSNSKKAKKSEVAKASMTAPQTEEKASAAKEAKPAPAEEKPAADIKVAANVPAPSAPAAPAAAADEKAVMVERIDFKKLDDKGRLTVASSAKTEYSISESDDGRTLVVDLKGALISEDLSRTLDATKLKTPVISISSYQESVKPKDVRILVKLSDKTPYEVKEENGVVNIDFALPAAPEKVTGAEAAAAPKSAQAEAKKMYTGKKIDLDMMDANITDVLRLLAEVSNLNIIASDDVKGTITLRLKNVPWDQAFDIILKSKDLDSQKEGNVVRVAPAAKIRAEKEIFLTSKKAQEKLENLEIKFIAINYAVASELIKQVQGVLSERGSVTGDTRTNTLIVKDVKTGVESAENLVRKLDTRVPQVLIEARIVEATSNFARDLGIQWGADFQTGGHVGTNTFGSTAQPGQVPPIPGAALGPGPSPFTAGGGVKDFAVNLPAAGTAGPLGALGFILGKAGQNPFVLDLRLSAGEQEGRLKTISRPKITTMDNKEAKIEQGESIPFETTSAAGTSTIFVDANLSLTVTPHITPDGSVLMKIKASRNSVGAFRTSSGQPSINKKESTTDVLVKDGETTVIGGIVVSDKNESDKGIPVLKDIPVLGWLFKSKSVNDSQTELLIFITPTIVKDKTIG